MARFSHALLYSAVLTTALGLSTAASAAVTPQVLINFDGTLTGPTYNLALGELDNSGTFSANGFATVGGGLGDVPGDLDNPGSIGPGGMGSGFYFDALALGIGSLTTQNWVAEAVVSIDTPIVGQPSRFNNILDIQGDTFLRFDDVYTSPKNGTIGYWDGGSEDVQFAPSNAGWAAGAPRHVALAWDSSTKVLTAYVGAFSSTATTGNAFDDSSSSLIGYGFFARFFNRAIDGKFDSVAFSTYTGAFNPATDFILPVPVPEPASAALLGLALIALPRLARKK